MSQASSIDQIVAEGDKHFAMATKGDWQVRAFVSAPATDKSKAIEKRKITPIQRSPLGSLRAEDAEFIVFMHQHWPAISEALASYRKAQAA